MGECGAIEQEEIRGKIRDVLKLFIDL